MEHYRGSEDPGWPYYNVLERDVRLLVGDHSCLIVQLRAGGRQLHLVEAIIYMVLLRYCFQRILDSHRIMFLKGDHDLELSFSSVAVRSVGELVGESRLYSFRTAGD